jgi:hypothetical protein
MNGEDWAPVLTVDTTAAELETIIVRMTAAYIAEFRQQLENDPDLTPAGVAYAVAKATPLIANQTRGALLSGWYRLQAEAGGAPAHLH